MIIGDGAVQVEEEKLARASCLATVAWRTICRDEIVSLEHSPRQIRHLMDSTNQAEASAPATPCTATRPPLPPTRRPTAAPRGLQQQLLLIPSLKESACRGIRQAAASEL